MKKVSNLLKKKYKYYNIIKKMILIKNASIKYEEFRQKYKPPCYSEFI